MEEIESSLADDLNRAAYLAQDLDSEYQSQSLTPGQDSEPEPEMRLADVMQPAIQTSFDIFKPHWNIKEHESTALAESYAAVIEVFFPDTQIDPRLAVAGMALMTTFAVIQPRIKADIEAEEKRARKAQEKEVNARETPTEKQPADDPLAWNN